MKPHITARDSLHITLFMTSQPGDPRPDPFSAFGGQSVAFPLDGAGAARSIPGASPAVLASEQAAFARLAAATPAPTLEVCLKPCQGHRKPCHEAPLPKHPYRSLL
jgi:hypothetical protein